ncbi:MAG: GGDEF domain-containing protein [Fimbriimonadaceae bacterium]|nr:GGDEF domain-containing protein [Fimbriimonadaceae bacterium]
MSEFEDTERQNQFLLESNLRLQRILNSLPVAMIGVDTEGRIFEMNDAAQTQFGYPHFEVFEASIAEIVLGEEDREEFTSRLQEAVEADRHINFELPAVTKDGNRLMVDWNVMPMKGMNGAVSSVRLVASDITERVMQADRLRDLAFKDALTGLCNRRSFMDAVGTVGERSQGTPCSVILMDVDKFKNYNDTYGHPDGDTLLRRIGDILGASLRDPYLPARFGGEEFVVLLPGADEEQAFRVAERLRLGIEEQTQDLRGSTVSLGVSTTYDLRRDADLIIEQADQALYRSKHNGRNQTSRWSVDLAA